MTKLKSNLSRVISMFFARPPADVALLPTECEIFMGVHNRLSSPAPAIPRDPKRARQVGAMLQHGLKVDRRRVTLVNSNAPYRFDASQPFSGNDASHSELVFLEKLYLRGDMVWDDEQTLEDANFSHSAAVAKLSTVVRQRNFQRNFSKVLPPADVSGTSVAAFYASLASNTTYDLKGEYYAKYRAPSPSKPEQRVADGEHLSDAYLRHNFFEVVPAKNTPHLLLRAGKHRIIYELTLDKSKDISARPILETGAKPGESIWDYLTRKNPTQKPMEAIFFLSASGPAKFAPPKIASFAGKTPIGAEERVIDPRIWVRDQWEEPAGAEDRLKLEWDWFTAMVDMRFGDSVYEVHVNRSELAGLDRKKLVFEPLEEALSESKGEFRKRILDAIRRAKRRPTINYFVQGMALEASGNRRYIGSDHGYAYIRRLEEGLVTRVPNQLFVQDLKIAVLADRVFQATKHLIPIIMVFTILATAVIALPVIGAATLWSGFVWLVKDQIFNLATKKAVREALKRFRRQLQFLFVDALISLFPRTNLKWVEFTRGFLRGFARDALESLLKKYQNFVVRGPSIYRWYKLFSRIEATLKKLVAKIEELKGVIDAAAGKLLIERFTQIGSQAETGAVLLFSNVYFLDYDAAEGAIEAFADLADQKPITRAQWEKDRTERLKILLTEYSKPVREAALKAVKSGTKVAYKSVRLGVTGVSVAQDFLLLTKLSGHFGIVCMVAGVGGLAGLVALEVTTTKGKIVKMLGRLLSKGPKALIQRCYSAKEMRTLGQFLGHVVGGFFLNGAIFAKGTRLGKLAKPNKKKSKKRSRLQRLKEGAISSFVKTEFGHGHGMPVIKLVLSHYLLLFQRLRSQSEDLWEKIEKDLLKQLYGTAQHQVFLDQGRQPITFDKAKVLLSTIDTLLISYLDELLATPDLDKKLTSAAKYLEKAKAPSWDDLLEGRAPKEFSREAVTFAAIAHARTALEQLSEMLRLIMDPVRTAKGHEVSILDLLNILGITTSEEEAQAALSTRLTPIFGNAEQRKQTAGSTP